MINSTNSPTHPTNLSPQSNKLDTTFKNSTLAAVSDAGSTIHNTESSATDQTQSHTTLLRAQQKIRNLNRHLADLNLPYKLNGNNELIADTPRNLDEMEAQPPLNRKGLGKIYTAALALENSEDRNRIMNDLVPIIQRDIDQIVNSEGGNDKTRMQKVTSVIQSYSNFFGGKDLGIDDVIGAVNAARFSDIDGSTALQKGNFISSAAVFTFMLMPTAIKNGVDFAESIQDQRWADASKLVGNTVAIGAMLASPVLAGLGAGRASAVSAAAGNSLVILEHLPEVYEAAKNFLEASFSVQPNSDDSPFTAFANRNKMKASGAELIIGTLHGLVSQGGMLGLNVQNALGQPNTNDIAAGMFGGTLMATALLEGVVGERPFSEFSADREHLSEAIGGPHEGHLAEDLAGGKREGAIELRGKIALQQTISALPASELESLGDILGTLTRADSNPKKSFAELTSKFTDTQESNFAKEALSKAFSGSSDINLEQAVDNIFRFKDHGVHSDRPEDTNLTRVLDFMQQARSEDKAWSGDKRGANANAFFKKFIAIVVNIGVLYELTTVAPLSADGDALGRAVEVEQAARAPTAEIWPRGSAAQVWPGLQHGPHSPTEAE